MSAAIVWFRRDLRLHDNPALIAAAKLGLPIIPIFIWAPHEESPWQPGAASRWWLRQSLASLSTSLQELGCPLVLRTGSSQEELLSLIKESSAQFVFWNRLYDPATRSRDEVIKSKLSAIGLEVRSFNAHLLIEPWRIQTAQGAPYQVFTPFHRACEKITIEAPASIPKNLVRSPKNFKSLPLEDLGLLPKIRWDKKLEAHWVPGEKGATALLKSFLRKSVSTYKEIRDFPKKAGTSRLSPHLHFGEISPREVFYQCVEAPHSSPYVRQLFWREFAHHILFHFPETALQPLRKDFEKFEWLHDEKLLRKWQRGQTGIPIVDAGMRELWETGWMHNRVRMIVASFLTKHLLHSWLDGAKWFWETLVDADLANNSLGWQWAGGCGADAAPYFRIFNPSLQSEKFDPDSGYIRHWVPEFENPKYLNPIIDLKEGRERALATFKKLRAQ